MQFKPEPPSETIVLQILPLYIYIYSTNIRELAKQISDMRLLWTSQENWNEKIKREKKTKKTQVIFKRKIRDDIVKSKAKKTICIWWIVWGRIYEYEYAPHLSGKWWFLKRFLCRMWFSTRRSVHIHMWVCVTQSKRTYVVCTICVKRYYDNRWKNSSLPPTNHLTTHTHSPPSPQSPRSQTIFGWAPSM